MKKILLVKTSSLGDVVHNLPVATDLARHFPNARIDWVVEESFAALPALHPAVHRVIPVAVRRWRKRLFERATWTEIGEFRRLFAAEHYDAVIDTQGLIKSALIAREAGGESHGYNAACIREPMAARLYDVTHAVPRNMHAVERNRALAAAALHYRAAEPVDYGIAGDAQAGGGKQAVLLHATSRGDKQWPEASWMVVGQQLARRGLECLLPWGNEPERERAVRLAASIPLAAVMPRTGLDGVATVLSGAACVVGLDTGLTHLAAAFGRPVVAIFCASSPELTGVYGARAASNLGGPGIVPQADEVLDALSRVMGGT